MGKKGIEGGSYKILSEEDILKIHNATLFILENIGVKIRNEKALKLFNQKGAKVDFQTGIVKFPPELFMKLISTAPSKIKLCGRNPENDLDLENKKVYLGTGGTALNILDIDTGQRRPTTLNDLKNICRLVDALNNIHFIVLPIYPNEIEKSEVDVNRFWVGLSNTTKHIMGGIYSKEGLKNIIKMAEKIAGGYDKLRDRPIISVITCAAISPLTFDYEVTELLMLSAMENIPCVCPSEPLSGATAPATLAGNVLILNTETLVGIALTQAINPGSPVLYGCVGAICDMRTMCYASGAIENALINAAAAQMAQFYKIPIYATSGLTDSKISDIQAGYEKAISTLIVALAGANFIHDSAGLLESALTVSFEQYVIDDEINGMVIRALEGMKVNEETLLLDSISSIGPGGNFLTDTSTLKWMRKEFFYPNVANKQTWQNWKSSGSHDAKDKAKEIARKILKEHNPELI